ncbi:hypothetical protein M3Y98_00848300 [Aphelenchoides besseyi]|nr:hypothetical protein M3Y98_00848300 [Aphelenchoides besseyi]KAI6202436.1 hypothetical protein M3Y96_00948300 [Aphelenchoides besseyi]
MSGRNPNSRPAHQQRAAQRGRGNWRRGNQKRKSDHSFSPPPSHRARYDNDGPPPTFYSNQQQYGHQPFLSHAAPMPFNSLPEFAPPPAFPHLNSYNRAAYSTDDYNQSCSGHLPRPPQPPNFGNKRSFTPQKSRSGNSYQRDRRPPILSTARMPSYRNQPYQEPLVPLKSKNNREAGECSSDEQMDERGDSAESVESVGEEPEEIFEEMEDGSVQARLRECLELRPNEVPGYVMRMREMGPMAYPPALIDQYVRVNEALPFFGGTIENILPKRQINVEQMPGFRGFTHITGTQPSREFGEMMERLAQADYQQSHQDAMERSGIDSFRDKDDSELIEARTTMEPIHYEIPAYPNTESNGYAFASETKTMKHTLEKFADGIQPFEHQNPNEPTFFMQKLRGILGPKKMANGISETGDATEIND